MTDEDMRDIIAQSQGFPPTDESGGVDLEQIDHNLSLTPEQRFRQYFQWLEFVRIVREAGKRHYGVDPRSLAPAE